ncbi:MAG: DUF6076 domain-containing protein [Clostridia bacterium]
MNGFNMHFNGKKIYLDNNQEYVNNEILTAMLNAEINTNLLVLRDDLLSSINQLQLYTDMSEEEVKRYDSKVRTANNLIDRLNNELSEFPIYQYINPNSYKDKLEDILNSHDWIWDDNLDTYNNDDIYDEDFTSQFGFTFAETNDYGVKDYNYFITYFIPKHAVADYITKEDLVDLDKFNSEISEFISEYIVLIDDVLRVKKLYTDLVDNYLNQENRFLTEHDFAESFKNFVIKYQNQISNHMTFTSGMAVYSHTAREIGYRNLILCKTYNFKSLGAFLYHDFFFGVENNYIPKKCAICGKYFLIKAGKYTEFCESIAPGETKKTCKEIGSRKKYDDKCKGDPVWSIYNKAYKAHYARYMKKKMTVAEFEKWSSWAIEIRNSAEKDEIKFEDYVKQIKK